MSQQTDSLSAAVVAQQDSSWHASDSLGSSWSGSGAVDYWRLSDSLYSLKRDQGTDLLEVEPLPQYYQETFFSGDSLLHPEVSGHGYGQVGEPMPYLLRHDNVVTSLLLICLVAMLFAFAHNRRFAAQQLKGLFFRPNASDSYLTETPGERRVKLLMTIQTCLLLSLGVYLYSKEYVASTYVLQSDYQLIIIFFAMLLAYLMLKDCAYTIVNGVFFDGKRNGQFLSAIRLVSALQGVLVYPVVLLLVYFGISLQTVIYYFAGVVILGKILAFYKSYIIFFRQNEGFLQIILYFCALEIVPLGALVGAWLMVVNLLKVNF